MTNSLTLKGRIMALDLGEKRIGVAISDPTRTIAAAHSVIERTSRQADFAAYRQIIAAEGVNLLIVGLPVTLSGEDSAQTAWVRDYTAELAENVPVPVHFWDEAMTTMEAQASLRARGKKGKKARERIDAVAAAFILQSYLDSL